MDVAAILRAISDGGASIIELVIIWFLWRELTRSRMECAVELSELRRQQTINIRRISRLEGHIDQMNSTQNQSAKPQTQNTTEPHD